nr:excalibur calcium-binding domain-containing protein [Brevibacillus fulvus]
MFVIDGGKSEAVASVVRSETESGVDSQAATPAAAEHQTSPAKSVNANPQTVQQTTPVVYKNCSAVRAAGAAPLRAGEPGYSRKLDRDGDGIACE